MRNKKLSKDQEVIKDRHLGAKTEWERKGSRVLERGRIVGFRRDHKGKVQV